MNTVADPIPPSSRVPPGPAAAPNGPETPHETSFLEPLERMFATLRRMATNYALLAVLDARRAALQLAWLIGAGILIAVLVVTAWLAGVVALAVILLGRGMSWPAVLGVAALLNLVGAGLVVWRVKEVFDRAPFAAVLRQIKAEPPLAEKTADRKETPAAAL
ncbi:MAG TPA: hypothetical protein VM164_06045 [Burkholderiales bacterium]|nr:hypothetical protein [Burkholderiales bacterium]